MSLGIDLPRPARAGIIAFPQPQAEALGQREAFRLNLRRLAWLPATPAFFPDIDSASHGVTGRAPRELRRKIQAAFDDMAMREAGRIDRLGPVWAAE